MALLRYNLEFDFLHEEEHFPNPYSRKINSCRDYCCLVRVCLDLPKILILGKSGLDLEEQTTIFKDVEDHIVLM